MSDVNKKIDETLDILSSYDSNIRENIDSLQKQITDLEKASLNKSIESFNDIKEDITSLEDSITKNERKVSKEYERKFEQESLLKVHYFTTLTSIKNDVMSFAIENLDSMESAFDSYHNTTLELKKRLENSLNSLENTSIAASEELSNALMNKTLNNYRKSLSDYNNNLSSTFSSIKESIDEIKSLFDSAYSEYREKVNKDKQNFIDLYNTIYDNYPSYREILNNKNVLNDRLKEIEQNIIDNYESKQNELFDEFKNESDKQISHYEKVLSKVLDVDEDFFSNKEKVLNDIKSDIVADPNNKKLIQKLEKAIDTESLEECVTEIYKKLNKDTYEKYLKEEKKNEHDFLIEFEQTKNKRLFTDLLLREDKLKGASLIENSVYLRDISKDIDKVFLDYLNKTIANLEEFAIIEINLLSTLKNVVANYKYNTTLYKNQLDFEYKAIAIELIREMSSLIQDETKEYDIFRANESLAYAADLKYQAILDYEIKLNRVHRSNVIDKSIVKLAYELSKDSKEIDLLPYRFEYEKIIDTYNINKKSLDVIKDSQVKLLEQSKLREELYNISTLSFLKSFMRHRIEGASQLIDLSKKELELRVEVLNKEKELANGYSEYRINTLIGKYLDEISELNQIKEIKLKSILLKIDSLDDGSMEFKDHMTELTNEVLTDYNDSANELINLIKNDNEIADFRDDIEGRNEFILNSTDSARLIHNHMLLEGIRNLKIAEGQIDSLFESLNSIDNFDYSVLYKGYLDDYEKDKFRLDDNLDKNITPLLYEIRRIASKYNFTPFYRAYKSICDKHQNEVNGLYLELMNKKTSIDNENMLQFVTSSDIKENTVSLIDDINKKALEEVNSAKESLDNLNQKAKEILDYNLSDIDNKKSIGIENTKEEFVNFKSLTLEKIKILDSLTKESSDALDRIQKKSRKTYEFEYQSFEDAYKTKINEINKSIKEKYKSPTVYQLKGDKK